MSVAMRIGYSVQTTSARLHRRRCQEISPPAGTLTSTSNLHPNFIQHLVSIVLVQVDIDDDIISYMLFAMANTKSQVYFKAPTTPQFGAVTYLLGEEVNCDDEYITIQENRNVISGFGTTGYRTWEAALALGEYILSQRHTEHSDVDVVGKRILEVGAGTGFVSLLCGKLGAAKVFGTDGYEDIVLRLRRNIEDNKLANVVETRVYKWGNSSGDDTGHVLERESREADYKYTDPVDLILGADIVSSILCCCNMPETKNNRHLTPKYASF
jgi:predicted nicotinamide N-methyase